ncbi:MAG: hypothetical protein SGARI_006963 [Bacillariaceae sp.]
MLKMILGSDNFPKPNNPSTYGEITTLGTRQLLQAMDLFAATKNKEENNNDIHFFDLGSGVGKLVTQVAMELGGGQYDGSNSNSSNNNRSVRTTGVGLSPTRHEAAERAQEELRQVFHKKVPKETTGYQFLQDAQNNVKLIQGDLFQVDLSCATHIYVASLCFPPTLMKALETKLIQECTSKNLQYVATLKRFPNDLYPISQGSGVYLYRIKQG